MRILLYAQSLTRTMSSLPLTLPTPSVHVLTSLPSHQQGPNGHIGRYRNAFMIFLAAYCTQVVRPYRAKLGCPKLQIRGGANKAAGQLWKSMSEKEKEPWNELSHIDELVHAMKYPDYKFLPASSHSNEAEVDELNDGYEEFSQYMTQYFGQYAMQLESYQKHWEIYQQYVYQHWQVNQQHQQGSPMNVQQMATSVQDFEDLSEADDGSEQSAAEWAQSMLA